MSLAKYRKVFKNGLEVKYPVSSRKKDQKNGSKESKADSLPKEGQVGNG
jgi:hypothetical protein